RPRFLNESLIEDRDDIFILSGTVNDSEFDVANIPTEVCGLPLDNRHLTFDMMHSHQHVIEHHQPDPGMQEHHACPTFENRDTTCQEDQCSERGFHQLIQNAHR